MLSECVKIIITAFNSKSVFALLCLNKEQGIVRTEKPSLRDRKARYFHYVKDGRIKIGGAFRLDTLTKNNLW